MRKYIRFQRPDGQTGSGLVEGETVAVITEPFWQWTGRTGEELKFAGLKLLTPCDPRSIVCVGLNYRSHIGDRPIPDPPTLFFKPLSSIAGPGDDIVLPEGAGRVDPEGEIVIVIGKEISKVDRAAAQDAIFGYTCGNDVSAREWQRSDGQWWRAKGSDTFGIFGPSIVTGIDHDKIDLRTRVNGTEVQHGGSHELILDIPEIVRYVASVMTLLPGDIIYTGTPGSPPRLAPGDVVEVEITDSGVLRNTVAG
jgi:2-keto-4-pentenoate hydratase/2-oxohepta-3-ene-1,7-dioic acid hydratase in catechol pathway